MQFLNNYIPFTVEILSERSHKRERESDQTENFSIL